MYEQIFTIFSNQSKVCFNKQQKTSILSVYNSSLLIIDTNKSFSIKAIIINTHKIRNWSKVFFPLFGFIEDRNFTMKKYITYCSIIRSLISLDLQYSISKMIKTSNKPFKTKPSHQPQDYLPVNSSLQNWRFNSRYQKHKSIHPSPTVCYSCGSEVVQFDHEPFTQATEPSQSVYLKSPLTPVSNRFFPVPQVSQSFSQYKEGSKLSLQLNQISMGFNKENTRMQQALFKIRQSTVKKHKSKYTKSLSMSKKSCSSKKNGKLKLDQNSILKVLNFSNFVKVCQKQLRKDFAKDSAKQTKLKKKNINQLMKEQRSMLKTLASSIRNSLSK